MFLLVIFLFITDPSGNPTSMEVITQPVATMEQCDVLGRNLREYTNVPAHIKSMSYCVSPEDYRS